MSKGINKINHVTPSLKWRNTSKMCDKALAEIYNFCMASCSQLNKGKLPRVSSIWFRNRNTKHYSGRCWIDSGRIVVSFKNHEDSYTSHAYRKRGVAGAKDIRDVYETVVMVTAHEMWHATGCRDEDSCELAAYHAVDMWRKANGTEWMDSMGYRPAQKPAGPKRPRQSRIPRNVSEAISEANRLVRRWASIGYAFPHIGPTEVRWGDDGPEDVKDCESYSDEMFNADLRDLRRWIAKNGCDGRTVELRADILETITVRLTTDPSVHAEELIA